MRFTNRQFRDALGHFATGVTVITTLDDLDRPIGLTANSFNSVSLTPPLVLFSLGHASNSRPHFQDGKPFNVHILGDDQVALSNRFAKSGADKFDGVSVASNARGVPILDGVLTVFECTVDKMVDAGDHVVVIGLVHDIAHDPHGRPLLYYKGRYAVVGDLPVT